ncbi:MAG: STAS domain-containing protein [Spirochaetales bacterium]|nr:STAS domain-containing protein [Spirochaetales bacterium]
MTTSLLYQEETGKIYIRAIGRMTANLCHGLREKVFSRLDNTPKIHDIFVDLSQCDYMDSTFMGILIGINKQLKELSGKGITVVCPTDECNSLFAGLNIIRLLHIDTNRKDFPDLMEEIDDRLRPSAEVLLHAHEDLIDISENNAIKFKILKEQLEKKVEMEKKQREENAANLKEPEDSGDDT